METATLISNVITFTDNVTALDAENATRRLRYLLYAQEIFEEVWNWRDWPFKYVTGSITVAAADGDADLPADFQEFGNQGGVYIQATGRMLHEVTPQEINVHREAGATVGDPGEFAVYGFNTTTDRK